MKIMNKITACCIALVIATCAMSVYKLNYNYVEDASTTLEKQTITTAKTDDDVKRESIQLTLMNTETSSIKADNIAHAVESAEKYTGTITKYTDLSCRMDITEDQLNYIIERCTVNYPDSAFKGTASAFIEASQKTGYDPIFLLSLAGQESGWNVSDLHRKKSNPYSIAMFDEDPELGYVMGDTFAEGIVNGAIWIHKNYYEEGQTTLTLMNECGNKIYATDENWVPNITSIMDACYRYLMEVTLL